MLATVVVERGVRSELALEDRNAGYPVGIGCHPADDCMWGNRYKRSADCDLIDTLVYLSGPCRHESYSSACFCCRLAGARRNPKSSGCWICSIPPELRDRRAKRPL